MRKTAWPAAFFLAAIALTGSTGVAAAQQLPPAGIFHAMGSNKCMDIDRANLNVIQWTCNGGTNQKFQIVNNPDRTITLRSSWAPTGCVTNYQGRVGIYLCEQGANEQMFAYVAPGVLRSTSGQCLGVENASTADGAKVVPQTCNGSRSQGWGLEPVR